VASKFTDAVDTEFRDFIKSQAESAVSGLTAFKSPWFFQNVADYASALDVPNELNLPIFYLMTSFGDLKDLKKGCDDDPDVFVTYNLELFRRYFQSDDRTKCSHDIVVKSFTLLRDKFLDSMDVSSGKTQSGLKQVGPLIKFRPSNYVLGTFGDWMNLSITFEVTS
jgi:hypothetical protein